MKRLLLILAIAPGIALAGTHMRDDLMHGWYVEDDGGRETGHLRDDLMGGWYVEDQGGREIGHWRSDLMGGWEYQPN